MNDSQTGGEGGACLTYLSLLSSCLHYLQILPLPPLSPSVAPTPVEVVMIDGKRRCQLLGVLRALKQRQPTAEFRYR